MSISATERDLLHGGDGDVDPIHEDHDCEIEHSPARVFVDGTQIPVINEGIRTEIRKDGPLSITRHSEVYFPSEWKSDHYAETVRALDPHESNVYDPVDIEIRDAETGEYVTVHRGFVMATGGGSEGNIERRMHVGDVSQLLGAIPFSESYNENALLEDVLEDAVTALEETITPQVFDSVELVGVDGPNVPLRDDPSGFFVTVAISELIDRTGNILFGRSGRDFLSNRNSIQDVFDWLEDKTDFWFYFAPSEEENTIQLVAEYEPTKKVFRATHITASDLTDDTADALWREQFSEMGRVQVVQNNALYEISPVNTVTVQGEQYRPGALTDYEEYPIAKATHQTLKEKAGMELQPEVIPDNTTNENEARQRAQNELKEMLDGISHGEIVTQPAPDLSPYSTLHSKTACDDRLEYDAPPLEYEVEEVIHNITAQNEDGERVHETRLRVGIKIDPDDIEVTSKSVKGNEVASPDFAGGVTPGAP